MEPTEHLARTGQAYQAARDNLAQARAELMPAIENAIRAEIKQVDIVRMSGLTREHIRRIARRIENETADHQS